MGKFTFLGFVRSQWMKLPAIQRIDLSGRTVVVTGANTGLGFEAVKHFARMGPEHLVIVCRNKAKGEAAIEEIKAATGFQAELLLMDMADFASVSAFATAFEEKYDRLDILVCNAGVLYDYLEVTKDGHEASMQVNHLSTALVSLLLLPIMTKTAKTYGTASRLAIVSSEMHYMAKITSTLMAAPAIFETLASKEYSTKSVMAHRYQDTKLFNVLFGRSLTAHLPTTSPIVVDTVNPGFCYSSFRRNVKFPVSLVASLMEVLLARQTDEGAKCLVWGATAGMNDPVLRDSLKGAYTSDCKVEEPSDFIFTKEGKSFEQRVWTETLDILSKADPRVRTIASEYLTV